MQDFQKATFPEAGLLSSPLFLRLHGPQAAPNLENVRPTTMISCEIVFRRNRSKIAFADFGIIERNPALKVGKQF